MIGRYTLGEPLVFITYTHPQTHAHPYNVVCQGTKRKPDPAPKPSIQPISMFTTISIPSVPHPPHTDRRNVQIKRQGPTLPVFHSQQLPSPFPCLMFMKHEASTSLSFILFTFPILCFHISEQKMKARSKIRKKHLMQCNNKT